MAVIFRLAAHSALPGVHVVEVCVNGEVAAVIYPEEEKGVKIVSAHIEKAFTDRDFAGEVIQENGRDKWPPIPAHHIRFNPSPYIIRGKKIIRLKKPRQ